VVVTDNPQLRRAVLELNRSEVVGEGDKWWSHCPNTWQAHGLLSLACAYNWRICLQFTNLL
jgi:hypothetical protein